MSYVLATYSYKDITGSFQGPAVNIMFGGGATSGINKMMVRMSTERTVEKTGADGTVMPSSIAGDSGEIEIECLQNGTAHQQFVAWLNALITGANTGDVTQWASTNCYIKSQITGNYHNCQGVSPTKLPDVPYEAEGSTITWLFKCANIING
jgi:hypothetical protein